MSYRWRYSNRTILIVCQILIGDEPEPGLENLLEVKVPPEVEEQLMRLDEEEEQALRLDEEEEQVLQEET